MSEYNASDTRAIRKATKQAKVDEAERQSVVFNLMSSPAGRSFVCDLLERSHIFASTFTGSALSSAFSEGERNIGLQLLALVMLAAPDQYIQMTRESNDRRNSSHSQPGNGTAANGRGDADRSVNLGSVESEYEPGLFDEVDGDTGAS